MLRLHFERGGVDRIDLVAPGRRFGEGPLQHFLGPGAPDFDLDAVFLFERDGQGRQVFFGKARVQGKRAFLLRRRDELPRPVRAVVAQERSILREAGQGRRQRRKEQDRMTHVWHTVHAGRALEYGITLIQQSAKNDREANMLRASSCIAAAVLGVFATPPPRRLPRRLPTSGRSRTPYWPIRIPRTGS